MPIVIVTGTPGTGKTTIAKLIAQKLKLEYMDANKLIKEKKLAAGYDKKRNCDIIDDKKLKKEFIELTKRSKNLVIDSHMSHLLPAKYTNICIVTKCDLKVLKGRLKKRGYSHSKIRENLDAEIFDNCLVEAEENRHNVLIVDTSKEINHKKLIKVIQTKLK